MTAILYSILISAAAVLGTLCIYYGDIFTFIAALAACVLAGYPLWDQAYLSFSKEADERVQGASTANQAAFLRALRERDIEHHQQIIALSFQNGVTSQRLTVLEEKYVPLKDQRTGRFLPKREAARQAGTDEQKAIS